MLQKLSRPIGLHKVLPPKAEQLRERLKANAAAKPDAFGSAVHQPPQTPPTSVVGLVAQHYSAQLQTVGEKLVTRAPLSALETSLMQVAADAAKEQLGIRLGALSIDTAFWASTSPVAATARAWFSRRIPITLEAQLPATPEASVVKALLGQVHREQTEAWASDVTDAASRLPTDSRVAVLSFLHALRARRLDPFETRVDPIVTTETTIGDILRLASKDSTRLPDALTALHLDGDHVYAPDTFALREELHAQLKALWPDPRARAEVLGGSRLSRVLVRIDPDGRFTVDPEMLRAMAGYVPEGHAADFSAAVALAAVKASGVPNVATQHAIAAQLEADLLRRG